LRRVDTFGAGPGRGGADVHRVARRYDCLAAFTQALRATIPPV